MNKVLLQKIARLNRSYKFRKRWQRLVSALIAIVVFCTVYALILPAITMAKQPICDCDIIHKELVDDTQNKMKSEEDYLKLAGLFKMFDDKTRVKILHALEQNEMCVWDLAVLLGVTKSAVSHQLKALRLANLVKFRREAQTIYYSLADSHVKSIINMGFEHILED